MKKPQFLKQINNSNNTLSDVQDDRPSTIGLLQQMSPELDPSNPKYIPDAKAGMLFDSKTREVFDSINLVVVGSKTTFVEWIPRTRGGGFVASYTSMEEAASQADPSNEIQKGIDFFCLTSDGRKVIVPFYKSKLKVAQRWTSLIIKEGHTHAGVWTVSSVSEKSQKGSYFNYAISFKEWVTEDIFKEATALADASADHLLPERTDI